MKANSWHHKLLTFIYPFEFGKHGKEGNKITKI